MVEKSDEFDECMFYHQSFPYQNFALRKSQHCILYGYDLLTWVCQGLSHYVGAWNVEFDECMFYHQSFPYQNFALRKSQHCILYGYDLLTWVCQGLSHYVGAWNVEVLSPDYP